MAYQLLDEISHALKRPETYIGSVRQSTISSEVRGKNGKFEIQELQYTPGLLKLFGEILDNSVDEYIRNFKGVSKSGLDTIKIAVTGDKITIRDNGGIPVEIHTETGFYNPTLIFGHLRAGSNFDDSENREVIGRNGLGSSLANIFSTYFSVRTSDTHNEFFQIWTENMRNVETPEIKKSKEHFTEISFSPDFSIFDEKEITHQLLLLMERKAILAAASNPGLKVVFNEEVFQFKSLESFVKTLYVDSELIVHSDERWTFVIATGENHPNVKFGLVNGAECSGGSHLDQIRSMIRRRVTQKTGDVVSAQFIDRQYSVWVSARVFNPTYSSQTKEILTTPANQFLGDNTWPTFPAKITAKIQSSGIISRIIAFVTEANKKQEDKELAELGKKMKKASTVTIRKLVDANAPKKDRKKCDLYLFEGASAGNSFRPTRNPQYQGCYLLKGKVMNTWGRSTKTILDNQELREILLALGVTADGNISNLRYGRVIIATDADFDGDSITGQLLTFFYTVAPQLLEKGYIYVVNSPIYKVGKQYFYNHEDELPSGEVSYFKGLGSLEISDYREMLKNPRLDQIELDAEAHQTLKGWMGGDSAPRQKYLTEEV